MSQKKQKTGNGKGWQAARPKYQNGKINFPANPQRTNVLPVFHRRSTGWSKKHLSFKTNFRYAEVGFSKSLEIHIKKEKIRCFILYQLLRWHEK